MTDLTGKRIIITGGASGMGLSLVEALPRLGAMVVSFDLNAEAGEPIAAAAGADFVECNVADEASVNQAVKTAVERLGGLDVLIHAAGIAPGSPAEDITLESWNKVMSINSTGTFLTNVAVFPYLKANGGGAILNFASAAGVQGYIGKAHYAASKGAVLAWVRSLAGEWGKHNIRVNAIAPAIWTPMYDKTRASMTSEQLAQHDAMMKNAVPMGGKLGDAKEDFAPIMAFLCSDDSHFMTGQVFAIDGGTLMLR
ncbi:SDR family NAD(P)-dependent oxidoreductase [Paenibacillus sp. G2S3]|uniref:SDR family NAD(P)-dependent oxidoreductase n=1 Tax=Paenibacillus sp. G2S3 TaxID=3047872 RepID=UPI0024C1D175|nr:SDR family NAD(P)-dependent oxidoreductase [Paenibacillus sp. G2S3]WHY19832.1 SDR family NAD(P)-dependent oxidoreductase [Paenibacillus sp. G2S3]